MYQTDVGTNYSVPCDEARWKLTLDIGDMPSAVMIQAISSDGTPLAVEGCLLPSSSRYEPTMPGKRRREGRGNWTRFGPGG